MHRALFVLVFLMACSVEPAPLQYGVDTCHNCKMTLVDQKFGSEIVTKKGRVYKFDDTNCLLNFYNSGEIVDEDIHQILVIDFAKPQTLVDARHSWFLKTDKIKTPMASQLAAFSSENDFEKYKSEWRAILLSWGEVVTQFK